MSDFDVTILGAGVIGLAIAQELDRSLSVLLVEKNPQFGQETSSRNSEVIHSGIYYPKDSQKTALCIEGRQLLYHYCSTHNIPHQKCGKFVVASTENEPRNEIEHRYLEALYSHSQDLQIPCQKNPDSCFFPESGIIDSHALMASFERRFLEKGGTLLYRHAVRSVSFTEGEWKLSTERGRFTSRIVVNAAGLRAAELSNQALATDRYQHRPCRGRYFFLSSRYQNQFKNLIYPIPEKDGLGVHVTIDMGGRAKLGPDVEWVDSFDAYDCDWEAWKPRFLTSARRLIRGLQAEDLSPGLIGIRPKLFIDQKPFPDFLIERPEERWIHCLGIESPGLTASLAIAKKVASLIR